MRKPDGQSGEASWERWHLLLGQCLPWDGPCNSGEMVASFRWGTVSAILFEISSHQGENASVSHLARPWIQSPWQEISS